MKLIVGKTSGFCNGVRNAVEIANKELEHSKNKIYCLGELVHNKNVIYKLKQKGLIFIENIEQAQGKVIIRAHGIAKSIYDKAKELKIELKDLTCPKVLKIHQIVEEHASKGYYIFLVGKADHPETIGTYSFCGKNSGLIQDICDLEKAVEKLKKTGIKKVILITQTTYNLAKFQKIAEKLKEILGENIELKIINSICLSTELRQKEAEKISKDVDLMIIIGDKKSSNTNKLYEISCDNCKNVIFVENETDIDLNYIEQFEKVGIMAGASTPKELIESIIEIIKNKEVCNA